jgi:hypothetical protein
MEELGSPTMSQGPFATLRGCYATDSGSAARAQARFARNGAMMGSNLASLAAAAKPKRWLV